MLECCCKFMMVIFLSSRRRHTRSYGDWSSDVCSSDLARAALQPGLLPQLPLIFIWRWGRRPGWRAALACSAGSLPRAEAKIGRASCRERVEGAVGGVGLQEKRGVAGRSADRIDGLQHA